MTDVEAADVEAAQENGRRCARSALELAAKVHAHSSYPRVHGVLALSVYCVSADCSNYVQFWWWTKSKQIPSMDEMPERGQTPAEPRRT